MESFHAWAVPPSTSTSSASGRGKSRGVEVSKSTKSVGKGFSSR